MISLPPRVVIAGTHSGVGKTTVATGLMAALTARGVKVASAKVGPDFIDPGYHALATGRPARNLDAWMCGVDAIGPLAGRAGSDADVLVIEGVMGLFDGAGDGTPSSTADIARILDAPVVLVIDASSMSQSVAAIVHGFATLDPDVRLAGLVLNRVGSPGHELLLRAALEPVGMPILGVLGRDDTFSWRDRHLGLVPVAERPDAVRDSLRSLTAAIDRSCDLDAVMRLASTAPALRVAAPRLPEAVGWARVALAAGPAFSFTYQDNLDSLAAAGAELVPFDPCLDERLPEGCTGLVAGGGFPEVYGGALADNGALLADVRDSIISGGLAVWAECGGLLWLADRLDGRPMAGVVATEGEMTKRLTLGYRAAVTCSATPLGPTGTVLRGHEFHYSTTSPAGDALSLTGRHGASTGGFASPSMLASYLHMHLGNTPELAAAFVTSCLRNRSGTD